MICLSVRIVLDTSVVVAGLRTRLGAGNAVLRLAHGLAFEAIDEFLAELAALIEPVELHFQWRPLGRDPNDEMVFEAAINGRADALVTYNIADFASLAERFKIAVMHPANLLSRGRDG